MTVLINNQTYDNTQMVEGTINANGRWTLYESASISTNNNQAIDANMEITSLLPNRSGGGKAKVMLLLERQDADLNWHPLHSLYDSVDAIEYDSSENGGIIPEQALTYGPNVYNPDGVSFDMSDGVNIIGQHHVQRGVLPAKVRLCIYLHERDYGNSGAFSSITLTLDYELRAE